MLYVWIHNFLFLEGPVFKKKGQFLNKDNLLSDKNSPSPNFLSKMNRKGVK